LKIVIDANVWVSAAIRKGPSHVLVERWMTGADFEVVMCPELLAEITEVLTTRERLRRWISAEDAKPYVEMITSLVDLVPDPPDEDLGVRDSDDSYLVSLARAHNCDFIITGDKDLLEWDRQEPKCITPALFLKLT
jgi:putative PIN family toxin of toxin-antitoxin system